MPQDSQGSAPPAAAESAQRSLPRQVYPAIEGFVETAHPDEIAAVFRSLADQLEGLKGARAEQGQKVKKAIEQTQALLSYLLEIRAKLQTERQRR